MGGGGTSSDNNYTARQRRRRKGGGCILKFSEFATSSAYLVVKGSSSNSISNSRGLRRDKRLRYVYCGITITANDTVAN